MPEHLWGMTTIPTQMDDSLAAAVAQADSRRSDRVRPHRPGASRRLDPGLLRDLRRSRPRRRSRRRRLAVAWRKLSTLKDPERLRPWLVSVAANEARQLLRRQRRRTVVELSVADRDGRWLQPIPPARTDDLDLANALARLDPDDRALLALRYVAGFDSTELARATGRSPRAPAPAWRACSTRLRTELQDD